MSIQFSDSRELKLEVKLSAIGMTEIGTASGNFASFSAVPDAQNTRPLNYDNNYNAPLIDLGNGYADYKTTRKVKQIPSLQNGYIPEVNTTPSVSSCTFAYGSFDVFTSPSSSATPHPVFTLLYGPDVQNYNLFELAVQTQVGAISNLKPPDLQENLSNFDLLAKRKPFIPFIRYVRNSNLYAEQFNNTAREKFQRNRTTYNIWNLYSSEITASPVSTQVILYEGPRFSANVPYIKTVREGTDGSSCFVSSLGKGKRATVRRIFPISKDALFYDPTNPSYTVGNSIVRTNDPAEIFFPTKVFGNKTITGFGAAGNIYSGVFLYREQVLAEPSDNSGFHINIANINMSEEDSIISIVLENLGTTTIAKYASNITKNILDNTIYRIEIELTPKNLPKILFKYLANGKTYEKTFTQLKAPVFSGKTTDNISYDVFLHFAGPNLMVGFTPDISNWNSINTEQITSNNIITSLNFDFPKNQTYICMNTQNSEYSFKYSSIIFDNYNFDSNLINASGSKTNYKNLVFETMPVEASNIIFKDSNIYEYMVTKNHVLMSHKTSFNKKEFVSQSNVFNNIADSYYLNSSRTASLPNKPISFFPDWRNYNLGGKQITYSNYDNPLVVYTRTTGLNDADSIFRSTNFFNSDNTLYPNFTNLRNLSTFEQYTKIFINGTVEGPVFLSSVTDDPVTVPADVKFLFDITKGNITSYVSNIQIQCNAENTNKSFINNSAMITLENLDATEEGWRILELIEKNVIVVTVNAGYGNEFKKYFQGAIKSITTDRSGSSSRTILSCQDLSSYLLESVYFEKTIGFATLRLGDIIRVIMNSSGFKDYFNDMIDINGSLNNEAYNLRLATNPSVNQDLLLATQFDRIKNKLDLFLSKFCKVGEQAVFRWEPGVYEINNKLLNGFVFDNRYASYNIDTDFKFTGIDINSLINALPNSTDPVAWHGLITDSFTVTTNTKPLAYRVETAGLNLLEGLYATSTDNDASFDTIGRLSPTRLKQVVDSLTVTTDVPSNYVGFRKQIKDIYDRQEFPSKQLTDFKHAQNKQIASKPFHTVKFNCYVTKPLKFWGTFYINAFDNNTTIEDPITDTYIYSSLSYTFDKKSNVIKAEVEGIRLPWTISGLEEESS